MLHLMVLKPASYVQYNPIGLITNNTFKIRNYFFPELLLISNVACSCCTLKGNAFSDKKYRIKKNINLIKFLSSIDKWLPTNTSLIEKPMAPYLSIDIAVSEVLRYVNSYNNKSCGIW